MPVARSSNLKLGIFQMVSSSFFFAIMATVIKLYASKFHPMQIVFFRSSISAVILAVWMFYKKIPLIGRDHLNLFVRAAAGFLALSLSIFVITKIELTSATVLNQTSPIFVVILSGFILKEKITLKLAAHVFIAFVGIILIVKPGISISSLPGFLGTLSGFFAAIAYIAIKKMMNREHPFTIIFSFTLVSTVASLFFFPKFSLPAPRDGIFLVGMGIAATIAQTLMTISYRHGPASLISPFSFANILFATLVGIVFFDEIPDAFSIAGALIIVSAGISLMRLGQKSETVVQFHGLR